MELMLIPVRRTVLRLLYLTFRLQKNVSAIYGRCWSTKESSTKQEEDKAASGTDVIIKRAFNRKIALL